MQSGQRGWNLVSASWSSISPLHRVSPADCLISDLSIHVRLKHQVIVIHTKRVEAS